MKTKRKSIRVRSESSLNPLGEFLAKSRGKKGLTLAEVAEAIGLKSGQSVWDWENGKGSGIPASTLLRLVKLYGVSPDEAYRLLLDFHQTRVERKISQKFQAAKAELAGRRR
ncbi:MAG: helix-turn-helix domain-containing protein [Bdellovibrionaceae bacterium]|nr:helix-turn-helix domain-containing protein [Pseudobdellovibrionaceae bacterium]